MTIAQPAPAEWVWRTEVLPEAASTNDVLAARLTAGEPVGLVVATVNQTAGHGRLGRTWVSAPGSGLAISASVPMPPTHPELVPLAAGLAAAATVMSVGLPVRLKWPNDVLTDTGDLKVAGVLCRAVGSHVVVGIGINVRMSVKELPTAQATALSLHGIDVQPLDLLAPLLRELQLRVSQLLHGADKELLRDYREACATLHQEVQVHLPDGVLIGRATDISEDGGLLIDDGEQVQCVLAGDVVHVRRS